MTKALEQAFARRPLCQKRTRPQDRPVPLGLLPAEDRRRIRARYPDLTE